MEGRAMDERLGLGRFVEEVVRRGGRGVEVAIEEGRGLRVWGRRLGMVE